MKYNHVLVEPREVATELNKLKDEDKHIAYVIPCHEYDGTLVLIVYKELEE